MNNPNFKEIICKCGAKQLVRTQHLDRVTMCELCQLRANKARRVAHQREVRALKKQKLKEANEATKVAAA